MKIAIVGPSGVGKDVMGDRLRDRHNFKYWGPTSHVIKPYAARFFGITEEEAYELRHEHREVWRQIGDDLRAGDSAYIARKTLENGDICVGIRARIEIEATIAEGLVDLVVWVDRAVPPDPTLEFTSKLADVVIENHWGIDEFHRRIDRLCRVLNLGVAK